MTFNFNEDVAFIYIIDPPHIVTRAIPLLLSIRHHYPDVRIYPYTRKDRYAKIPQVIHDIHNEHNATIQMLAHDVLADPLFAEPTYKQGPKLMAATMDRPVKYTIFLDTDTFLARPFTHPGLFQENKVAAVPESVAGFSGRYMERWEHSYGIFGLSVPPERVTMLRTGRVVPPYYNAGFFVFPQHTPDGQNFGKLWLDTALQIDHHPNTVLESRRPWLDQGSLSVAAYRAGMRFETLEPTHNYPLDGTEFKMNDGVFLYHYHTTERIEKSGLDKIMDPILVASGRFNSYDEYITPERTFLEIMRDTSVRREDIRAQMMELKKLKEGYDKKGTSEEREQWMIYHKRNKELAAEFDATKDEMKSVHAPDLMSPEWGQKRAKQKRAKSGQTRRLA